MSKKYSRDNNAKIFGIDYFSDSLEYDEREKELNEMYDYVAKLVNEFGYKTLIDEWSQYLKECVLDKKSAVNFMMLFFYYDCHEFTVENPYPFLCLLYIKLGFSLEKGPETKEDNEIFDTFDSIYVEMLIKAKIITYEDYAYVNLFDDKRFNQGYNEIVNKK